MKKYNTYEILGDYYSIDKEFYLASEVDAEIAIMREALQLATNEIHDVKQRYKMGNSDDILEITRLREAINKIKALSDTEESGSIEGSAVCFDRVMDIIEEMEGE